MANEFVIGFNCKLYRNTATYESPTWNEVPSIRDADLNLDADSADATTRGGNGWKQTVATLKDGSVTFEMIWKPGDDDFIAFRDAWLNSTLIDCAVMDGDITVTGTQGLRAEFMVKKFARSEKLADVVKASVEMMPGFSSNAPDWMEI